MNQKYEARKFNIPELKGISQKQVEIHLKLYEGYVKFTNTLRDTLAELRKDSEKNAYALGEVMRRFGFEFNGMRMHEYYFEQFEGGAKEMNQNSDICKKLCEKYGDWEGFINHFKSVGLMRGIGWTILAYDPVGKTPHVYWVNDHELGQLAGLPILLAMDMWEHAYMVDYVPAEKVKYVEAFFSNVNWSILDKRFGEIK
ncbi:MAG: Fe-Mn family superoxide dismutase [bacterium]|nr:Fe-Mn family superoxide dismutase [bacterium]